jgi:Peptidase family M23
MLEVAAVAGTLLWAPAVAWSYPWPLKPFDRQHPIRGAFDDPRQNLVFSPSLAEFPGAWGSPAPFRWADSFHFGVDIVARTGTPVYAVAPGTVYNYPDAVAVVQADGHEFSYWHIRAALPEHTQVTTHQLLGWVKPDWGHLHFAEGDNHNYLNPLRPGALQPFLDTTTPVVTSIQIRTLQGARLAPGHISGPVELLASAYDPPPLPLPAPWHNAVWTPALVRWRLLQDGHTIVPWHTAADFRRHWLPASDYHHIYAPSTRQNRPHHRGQYLFWLAHTLTKLAPGRYQIQVQAADTRGNTQTRQLTITIEPATPPLLAARQRGLKRRTGQAVEAISRTGFRGRNGRSGEAKARRTQHQLNQGATSELTAHDSDFGRRADADRSVAGVVERLPDLRGREATV